MTRRSAPMPAGRAASRPGPIPYNVNDAPRAGRTGQYRHRLRRSCDDVRADVRDPTSPATAGGDRKRFRIDSLGLSRFNNWWNDATESAAGRTRQINMAKYFDVRPYGATSPQGSGPNYSCTTEPITPLTDVTVAEGLAAIKAAIDRMGPNGNTNVPEGIAGAGGPSPAASRSHNGAPNNEKGNDKVVMVLTDGANTYTKPNNYPAGNKSTYAAYGYLQPGYNGGGVVR